MIISLFHLPTLLDRQPDENRSVFVPERIGNPLGTILGSVHAVHQKSPNFMPPSTPALQRVPPGAIPARRGEKDKGSEGSESYWICRITIYRVQCALPLQNFRRSYARLLDEQTPVAAT